MKIVLKVKFLMVFFLIFLTSSVLLAVLYDLARFPEAQLGGLLELEIG